MPLLKRAILAALLLCLPRAAGAASADSSNGDASHWANDDKSGCALFDASLRPGDTVSWSGACKDGRADGRGTASFSNNGVAFESFSGNFSGGVAADGPVTVKWGDGWSYDGLMQAGHFQGQGILINDKKDRFEGQWQDGKLNGQGSVIHPDGGRYDGQWKNDLPNGHGILTRADGSKLEGEFVDGKYSQGTPPELAGASDAKPTPASLDSKQASEPVKPVSALAGLSGKQLVAVDGASLNLIAIEGGIERDITPAGGKLEKTTFIFINDKLGTVAADAGAAASSNGSDVTGFFRLTDNGVEVRYADGRGEILSALDDGVLLRRQVPGQADSCRSFYPTGHAFSDAEKKEAVAEYASRLGLAGPDAKTGCPGDVAAAAPQPTPAPDAKPRPEHHAEVSRPAKIAKASLNAKDSMKDKVGTLETVAVRDSVVHATDAMPMPALAAPQGAEAAIEGPAAGGAMPGAHDASHCLNVESDGSHWGFRNGCNYDVQFSYCLAQGGNSLTGCGAGGVAGSVAAKGFGALLADKSFSETDAEHDFRWLACDGGAGEVVAHLDNFDPPSGRCVRAGDVASNQDRGK